MTARDVIAKSLVKSGLIASHDGAEILLHKTDAILAALDKAGYAVVPKELKGDLYCINGRLMRSDAAEDGPELVTDIGPCPDCSGDGCADDPFECVSKAGRSYRWRCGYE